MPAMHDDKREKKPRSLGRNLACSSCRKRRLRCDAKQPCATCLRSYNHAMLHYKPGRRVPVYPVCEYEVVSDSAPEPPRRHPSGLASGSYQTGGSASGPSYAQEDAGSQRPPPPSLDPPHDGYNYSSASSSSSVASPFASTSTPFHPSVLPHPQQTPSFRFDAPAGRAHPSPHSLPLPAYPQSNFDLPPPAPSSATSPIPSHPAQHQQNASPSQWLPSQQSTPAWLPAHQTKQSPYASRAGSDARPSLSYAHMDGHQAGMEALALDEGLPDAPPGGFLDDQNLFDGSAGRIAANALPSASTTIGADGKDEYLMQMLWPSWPPHLPPPDRLEHLVTSFFACSPISNQLFSKARFLSRLHLPPTNPDFPHPALLHAICAATARFVGGYDLIPPELGCPYPPPPASVPARNELPQHDGRPSWDGIGQKPAHTTPGIDGDFAQVHNRWAQLYIEQARRQPDGFMEAVQASVVLVNYYHGLADWLSAWPTVGLAVRQLLPLKIHDRAHHPAPKPPPDGVPWRKALKDQLCGPPKDEIERVERQNLVWLVYAFDTYATVASGMQGAMDRSTLRLALPTSLATFSSNRPPPQPSQFADFPDMVLLTQHPPEHANSSLCLQIKGTLLLRRVVDFVRVVGEGQDPRGLYEHNELDTLVTAFGATLPPVVNDPSSSSASGTGEMAVDRDLLVAHALPHICRVALHDPYFVASNLTDLSSGPLRVAINALLAQVHYLLRSSFDCSLLLPFLTQAWTASARCLLKFLEVAIDFGDLSRAQTLLSEVGVFRSAMTRMGDRLPLGHRSVIVLDGFIQEVLSRHPASGGQDGGAGGVPAGLANSVGGQQDEGQS